MGVVNSWWWWKIVRVDSLGEDDLLKVSRTTHCILTRNFPVQTQRQFNVITTLWTLYGRQRVRTERRYGRCMDVNVCVRSIFEAVQWLISSNIKESCYWKMWRKDINTHFICYKVIDSISINRPCKPSDPTTHNSVSVQNKINRNRLWVNMCTITVIHPRFTDYVDAKYSWWWDYVDAKYSWWWAQKQEECIIQYYV